LQRLVVAIGECPAVRHDRPAALTIPPASELMFNCPSGFATCYFSLWLMFTFVTTSCVPLRSPLTVTEFSAAAFASSFSKPDST
jgi:hypothetical protein